jgi:hypothetical protein
MRPGQRRSLAITDSRKTAATCKTGIGISVYARPGAASRSMRKTQGRVGGDPTPRAARPHPLPGRSLYLGEAAFSPNSNRGSRVVEGISVRARAAGDRRSQRAGLTDASSRDSLVSQERPVPHAPDLCGAQTRAVGRPGARFGGGTEFAHPTRSLSGSEFDIFVTSSSLLSLSGCIGGCGGWFGRG